jgi:hypothetical protein
MDYKNMDYKELFDKNAPSKAYDDFYVLELEMDNNKIKELGYSAKKVHNAIDNYFISYEYLKGDNNFWYTKPNKGNIASYYLQIADLMEKEWFRNSVKKIYVYTKMNNDFNLWYTHDSIYNYYNSPVLKKIRARRKVREIKKTQTIKETMMQRV